MFRPGDQRVALIAVAAFGCLAAGAFAGLDAGGHVDAFYKSSPAPRWEPAAVTPPADTGYNWATSATYAVSPPAGSIWGKDVGRDERAFFDTDVHDDFADDPKPVRIHRGRVKRAVEPPVPAADAMTDTSDDPVDGWVDPPAADAPQPEPLPNS